jgi:hypothetical protein
MTTSPITLAVLAAQAAADDLRVQADQAQAAADQLRAITKDPGTPARTPAPARGNSPARAAPAATKPKPAAKDKAKPSGRLAPRTRSPRMPKAGTAAARFLQAVKDADGWIALAKAREQAGMDSATASRTIARLVKLGEIERVGSSGSVRLRATQKPDAEG